MPEQAEKSHGGDDPDEKGAVRPPSQKATERKRARAQSEQGPGRCKAQPAQRDAGQSPPAIRSRIKVQR